MFNRECLVEFIKNMLDDYGFETCVYDKLCIDISAKGKKDLLFIKILYNIDSFQKNQAIGMKIMSSVLDAKAFLIGYRTRFEFLKDEIMYERFDVPTMTPKTFEMILNYKYPRIQRDRGGLYGVIDPIKLKNARKRKGLTRIKLAKLVGTTKKNIYDHERREFRASTELIEKLEKVLSENIQKVEIKRKSEESLPKRNDKIARLFERIGFWASRIEKAPFDIIIKKNFVAFAEVDIEENKIHMLKTFSDFVEEPAFIITKNKETKINVEIPIIDINYLKTEVKGPNDLKRLILKI